MTFTTPAAMAFNKRIQNLFDTTEDGEPAERICFGDDMKGWKYVTRCGQDRVVVCGPDGEIDLDADSWKNIFQAMGFAPAVAS